MSFISIWTLQSSSLFQLARLIGGFSAISFFSHGGVELVAATRESLSDQCHFLQDCLFYIIRIGLGLLRLLVFPDPFLLLLFFLSITCRF